MRSAGQKKLGYYPACPDLARKLGAMMRWPADKRVTVIDPTCGCGEALAAFAPPGAELWGVELSQNRSEAAASLLGADRVLWCGFDQCSISHDAFSAMWLNPPYDDELGGGKRTELSFLQRATPLLVEGGVLVFFMSARAFSNRVHDYLVSHYDQLWCFEHPPTDRAGYATLDVAIFVGVKRGQEIPPPPGRIPPGNWDQPPSWVVPAGRAIRSFRKFALPDEELLQLVAKSGVWRQGEVRDVRVGRPLLPLKLAHLPLVLASGRLNGHMGDHVARATVRKAWKEVSRSVSDDGKKEYSTQREQAFLSMRCLIREDGRARLCDLG